MAALPTEKAIIPPVGGWKENTVYLVDVAWKAANPVHRAMLHVGFVHADGRFGNYCEVWLNNYDCPESAGGAYYLKAVRELVDMGKA